MNPLKKNPRQVAWAPEVTHGLQMPRRCEQEEEDHPEERRKESTHAREESKGNGHFTLIYLSVLESDEYGSVRSSRFTELNSTPR